MAERRADTKTETRSEAGPRGAGWGSKARLWIAQAVWLAAVVCALLLAVGALLVALDANRDNALVKLVLDGADAVDLQVFSRGNGIFKFDGGDAGTKNALANWGLGAVAYLVVGRILERLIRP
jgi:hypothetical protein